MHFEIGDFLMELVQNSVEAGATKIEIDILETEQLTLRVTDNGSGMDEQTVQQSVDPFFSCGKHRRRQGLGLAFLKQAVEATKGSLLIDSTPGRGTEITAVYEKKHFDCPPLGDLARTIVECMHLAENCEVLVKRAVYDSTYVCRRSELLDALEGLQSPEQLRLAREYIAAQEKALFEGGAQ